jgi:hypothetical protein
VIRTQVQPGEGVVLGLLFKHRVDSQAWSNSSTRERAGIATRSCPL